MRKNEKNRLTKTTKIRVAVIADDEKTKSEHWQQLYNWSNDATRAYNLATSLAVESNETIQRNRLYPMVRNQYKQADKETTQQYSKRLKKLVNERFEIQKEATKRILTNQYGQESGIDTLNYHVLRNAIPNIDSGILTKINRAAAKRVKDYAFDIAMGRKSIPSYSDNPPMPMNDIPVFEETDGEWYLTNFPRGIRFKLIFGRKNQAARLIVGRIAESVESIRRAKNESKLIEDEKTRKAFLSEARDTDYKPGTVSIQLVKGRNGKLNDICLYLPYHYSPVKHEELDPNRVLGVDLGLNVPVVAAPSSGLGRAFIGSRKEALEHREGMQHQIRQIQREITHQHGGKGYKKRAKRLINAKRREDNYIQTLNHKYSRRVIEAAIRYRCGTIHLENLAGIGDRINNKVIRNWTYFQLKTYIEYKAAEYEIKVKFVDPAYTSQTCSKCGHWEPGQRDGIKFACGECGAELHADHNAAVNIAKSEKIVDWGENQSKPKAQESAA